MRNKGTQAVHHLTVNGEVGIRRTVYAALGGGTVAPADAYLGIVTHAVSVGAWIQHQLRTRLPMVNVRILDYFHRMEHVGQAAAVCFGEGSEAGRQWRESPAMAVNEEGGGGLLVRIVETRRTMRSPAKREALRKLDQYVAKRVEMLDYPAFRAQGFDIGSGPTEALCKTLTARLKGSGMRWDRPNAEALMALAALKQSHLWDAYWRLQRKQVA